MKQNIKKGLFYALAVFIAMFLLRILYGYIAYPDGERHTTYIGGSGTYNYNWSSSFEGFSNRNIASKKMQRSTSAPSGSMPSGNIDQKYEKVASINSQTSKFAQDETRTRNVIKNYNALIQFERSQGLEGNRMLSLAIGVDPTKFDNIADTLSKIGKLSSISIDKSDKTSEFKELNAKKAALEKIRDNLIGLKKQGGKIDEFVTLENRIFDIEQQIQALGLSLGEFDEENEFCTVKFALKEVKKASTTIPFSSRLKTAFEWTVKFYLRMIFILFLATGSMLFVTILIEKIVPVIKRYWK